MNADLFARLDQVLMDAETITQEEREDILEAVFPHDEPQAGHTPGPWTVVKNGTLVVQDSTGEHIVDAGSLNTNGEANARLIASAPELLEALKDLVEIAENFKVDGPYMDKAKHNV